MPISAICFLAYAHALNNETNALVRFCESNPGFLDQRMKISLEMRLFRFKRPQLIKFEIFTRAWPTILDGEI
jgi:hypothetical protein